MKPDEQVNPVDTWLDNAMLMSETVTEFPFPNANVCGIPATNELGVTPLHELPAQAVPPG
eukprot:COSAG01_NODE_70300_length_259_cov_0.587500_1_plen_59_part_01